MRHPVVNLILALTIATLLAACGEGSDPEAEAAAAAEFEARKAQMLAAMQSHFDTKVSLPPAVQEAFERGEISSEEIDARTATGEFEQFFQWKTPADLPADLVWEDGSDLPDIGSPNATQKV